MFNYAITTVVTTIMGTVIGWLLNALAATSPLNAWTTSYPLKSRPTSFLYSSLLIARSLPEPSQLEPERTFDAKNLRMRGARDTEC